MPVISLVAKAGTELSPVMVGLACHDWTRKLGLNSGFKKGKAKDQQTPHKTESQLQKER